MNTRFVKFALAGVSLAIICAGSAAPASATDVRNATPSLPVVTATAAAAQSSTTEGAKNFIASMGERGINFLGNENMSAQSKAAEFRTLLNDSFDMNTIARFSLGSNWNKATPAQQQEYLKLFKDMIVKVYSKRFSDYKGQKFEVRNARTEGKDSLVTSFIVPNDGSQVQVDWRVRNKNGSYKVVDIIVEGVSMSQTQRADFNSVIQRGGGNIEVLLNHLRGQ